MGLRNSVNNVGFLCGYSFPKNFVRTKHHFVRTCDECFFAKILSFLFSSSSFKSGLIRFYTKLHKKKKKSFVVKQHSLKVSSRLIRRVVVSSSSFGSSFEDHLCSYSNNTKRKHYYNKREKI